MSISTIASAYKAPETVVSAIHNASAKTGVDFGYLIDQAKVESGFRADAKAPTSSATGLYQFIESTWLRMVKDHGYKYGLEDEAAKISQDNSGRMRVSDPETRRDILALRKDPSLASLMAAEFAADNKSYLETNTSRHIGSTEMYMAHFLGAGGAAKFINKLDANPYQDASLAFPAAARANPGVFKDHATGLNRSLQQVYDNFAKKFDTNDITDTVKIAKSQPTVLRTADNTQNTDLFTTMYTEQRPAHPLSLRTLSSPSRQREENTASQSINGPALGSLFNPKDAILLSAMELLDNSNHIRNKDKYSQILLSNNT